MSHLTEYTQPSIYFVGRAERDSKHPKSAPGNLTISERHWWLAGWNDRDIELDHCRSAR